MSFVLTFILLLILGVVLLIFLSRKVPTCVDNLQNQNELDVDCGGPCVRVCKVEVADLIVLWARAFPVRERLYDLAAYVENPNPFGLLELPYRFRVYDNDNIPVKDVLDRTYLNPHERALITVTGVDLGFRTPSRTFISFDEDLKWQRLSLVRSPTIAISNKKISIGEGKLSLSAKVTNDSIFAIKDIELDALLYDVAGNALLVSRSFLPRLAPNQTYEPVFTWPSTTTTTPASSDIFARINLVAEYLIPHSTNTPK